MQSGVSDGKACYCMHIPTANGDPCVHLALGSGNWANNQWKGISSPWKRLCTSNDPCEPLICQKCPLSRSPLYKPNINKGCQGHVNYFCGWSHGSWSVQEAVQWEHALVRWGCDRQTPFKPEELIHLAAPDRWSAPVCLRGPRGSFPGIRPESFIYICFLCYLLEVQEIFVVKKVLLFYLFIYFLGFNWRIIALQCCIGFWCTTSSSSRASQGACVRAKLLPSCLTFCSPMGQQWVATSSSRGCHPGIEPVLALVPPA